MQGKEVSSGKQEKTITTTTATAASTTAATAATTTAATVGSLSYLTCQDWRDTFLRKGSTGLLCCQLNFDHWQGCQLL